MRAKEKEGESGGDASSAVDPKPDDGKETAADSEPPTKATRYCYSDVENAKNCH